MREKCRVGCVSRKVVLDKGSLNRERPVTKALKFPSCTRKSFFPIWTGINWERRSVYRENRWQVWWHDTIKEEEQQQQTKQKQTKRKKKKKWKTKVAILKIILSLTGSQWSALSNDLTCSCLLLQKQPSPHGCARFADCTSDHLI